MYASDVRHPRPVLEKKLEKLYRLSRGKRVDLAFRQPFLSILEKFGNPHLHLPPVLHVAGTNGKGSIIAMSRAILEEAGYKVHVYTSPHLVRFNERIVLAGEEISDFALETLIDQALDYNAGADITFFEITTALAFSAFARMPADILLLEVGLGGKMDCTNIVSSPLVSVINTVSFDHMEFLGETLEDIAREKAGIMKKNVPCVVGPQKIDTKLFENHSQTVGTPLSLYGRDWQVRLDQAEWILLHKGLETRYPQPVLKGIHQIYNAATAIMALKHMQNYSGICDRAIRSGLSKVHWPARLQDITQKYTAILPPGWSLILDGAHNQDGAQALAEQIKHWKNLDSHPVHLIFGMMKHKNPHSFLKLLLPWIDSLTVVDIPGESSAFQSADLISLFPKALAANSVQEAIKNLAKKPQEKARILIAGSLYLAQAVL